MVKDPAHALHLFLVLFTIHIYMLKSNICNIYETHPSFLNVCQRFTDWYPLFWHVYWMEH